MLKIEERGTKPNQYDLLREAGIPIPQIFTSPEKIDRLVLVKVLEKERSFERAFFVASTPQEYYQKSEELIKNGVITSEALSAATIEEFILGMQVNLNYFYSPLSQRLEFLGPDTRRQTNLEGFLRLPAALQQEMQKKIKISYEEAGHMVVTILESMLEQVYEIGESLYLPTKKYICQAS